MRDKADIRPTGFNPDADLIYVVRAPGTDDIYILTSSETIANWYKGSKCWQYVRMDAGNTWNPPLWKIAVGIGAALLGTAGLYQLMQMFL